MGPGLVNAKTLACEGQHRRANEQLMSVTRESPHIEEAWIRLGIGQARCNELMKAIATLEKASRLFPSSALTRYNLACYYARARQYPPAVENLRIALSLKQDYRELALKDSDFESLRQNGVFSLAVDPPNQATPTHPSNSAADEERRTELLHERIAIAEEGSQSSEEYRMKYDPIEDDPKLQPFFAAADARATAELAGDSCTGLGYCHVLWTRKQRILQERFGITWFSPAEMNPDCIFD